MSYPWDLMPPQCRARFNRRRQARLWISAYVATTLVLALVSVVLVLHAGNRVEERDRLGELVREHFLRNKEAAGLVEEIGRLQGDVTRYNRLAWPVRVSDVLAALAPLVPESAALTSLTILPTQPVKKKGAAAEGPADVLLAIELEGIAAADADVADLVAGLEGSALFTRVKLDYAKSRDLEVMLARQFRVKTYIDLSTQYVLVDAVEEDLP